MKLLDLVTAPWAIMPDKLLEIQSIYSTHMRGEKIDIAGVEARIGRPLGNERQAYEVINGVAVISIDGVISKRMNLLSNISGGVSTELVAKDFSQAMDDQEVKSIILAIDSPGGAVDGTQQLANVIRAARGKKPIVTYANETIASAAYWIGASADQIFISSDTTAVGSIGVVATHTDVSGREAAAGVKTTEVVAGAYKRISSQFAPLTELGRAEIQAQVDAIYEVFVSDVAKSRGVSVETVLETMADGKIFIGKAAIESGLVDGVSTLDELIARLSSKSAAGGAVQSKTNPIGVSMDITVESIAADHPEIAEAFKAVGRIEGATAERDRILGIEAQMLPGHQDLVAALKADGKTTPDQAAVQVLAAEKLKLAEAKDTIAAEANAPVAHVDVPSPVKDDPRQAALKKAEQYCADHPGTELHAALHILSKEAK